MQRNLLVALTIILALCVLLTVIPANARDDDGHKKNGNNSEKDKDGREKDEGGKAGPQGPPGPTGLQGPAGPTGTTGQDIARSQATPVTLNPGQTMTIATVNVTVTSASGGILVISSYGGITSSQPQGGSASVMDVGVLINGATLGNPRQRISITPASSLPQGTTPQSQTESWGFTNSSGIVGPGTYTINLVVQHISGPQVFVANSLDPPDGSGPFNSGAGYLQALVINR